MSDKTQNQSFESNIAIVDEEIRKRKSKWTLAALSWIDFEDVEQILRIHIYKKWSLYDHKKPLAPWLNIIISNQIKNIIRNNYGNYARPCLKCAAAEWDDSCTIYGEQCKKCPMYAHWESNKKDAFNTKITLPLENHIKEVHDMTNEGFDLLRSTHSLSSALKKVLKPAEWMVYEMLCLKNQKEEEVAKLLGFKTTEKNRSPGYKQIKNLKRSILIKAKKCITNGEVEIYG